ncbi:Hypothetical predicted protein [Pelobates cultripes]|uniref:Uncharacterized protein n=1 Tax=Pelobates cultripes TaxID=61616 RepID=A0AAD1S8R1_PELCU|nr:Hypothetical predicted protein [Pelobates cultripes]
MVPGGVGKNTSKNAFADRLRLVDTEDVVLPRKRATHRAKAVQTWKRVKALSDSSDSDSDSEEVSDGSNAVDPVYLEDSSSERSVPATPAIEARREADDSAILEEPLFNPDALHNPCSAEWYPTDHVAKYFATRVRKPLDKATRNKRPTVPNMACVTKDVDPKIAQFLGWKAKRRLDFSLRNCQDKLLDVLGPIAKIFNMVEAALTEWAPIDLLAIRGWIQCSICLIGNANTALATVRRKVILMKSLPKLLNLAMSEPGTQAKGFLFGDDFVKDLGKYVSTFTALDKAQTNMKCLFSQ